MQATIMKWVHFKLKIRGAVHKFGLQMELKTIFWKTRNHTSAQCEVVRMNRAGQGSKINVPTASGSEMTTWINKLPGLV